MGWILCYSPFLLLIHLVFKNSEIIHLKYNLAEYYVIRR